MVKGFIAVSMNERWIPLRRPLVRLVQVGNFYSPAAASHFFFALNWSEVYFPIRTYYVCVSMRRVYELIYAAVFGESQVPALHQLNRRPRWMIVSGGLYWIIDVVLRLMRCMCLIWIWVFAIMCSFFFLLFFGSDLIIFPVWVLAVDLVSVHW